MSALWAIGHQLHPLVRLLVRMPRLSAVSNAAHGLNWHLLCEIFLFSCVRVFFFFFKCASSNSLTRFNYICRQIFIFFFWLNRLKWKSSCPTCDACSGVAGRRPNRARFEKEEGFWNLNTSPAKGEKNKKYSQAIYPNLLDFSPTLRIVLVSHSNQMKRTQL